MKLSNEITVKLKCTVEEICKILESKGFQFVERYLLDDIYYIPNTINIKNMSERDILSKAIILRNVEGYIPNKYRESKLTYKKKEIDQEGNIVKQSKVDCKIIDSNDGKKFLEAIDYKAIMQIKEFDYLYKKNELQICIKDVLNGDKLIEIEENEQLDTIDKIKQEFKVRSEDEYFTLHFNVSGADSLAFVELLDAQDKVVRKRRVEEDGMVDFYFLNPGKYAARLINDRNGNGEWDTGDFEKGIQPEEVFYYPTILEYKALWDVTQPWDIHATPVDKQKPDELKKQKPDEDKKKKERNNQNRRR